MRKSSPNLLTPSDSKAVEHFTEVLRTTENLPYSGRWSLILELMPDAFFWYVLRSRDRKVSDALNLLGTLSLVVTEELLDSGEVDETIDTRMVTFVLLRLIETFVAELERRRKEFTSEVVIAEDPFDFRAERVVQYTAKDPETFDSTQLAVRYFEMARTEGRLTY